MAQSSTLNAPVGPAPWPKQPKRQSLAESIADSVAEAISTRHLKPGERIVELTLADQMGVSRVPVREALKVLHAQGIITSGGHRGYRVAAFDDQTVRNVVELRLMLESILLRDAIHNWRKGRGDLAGLHEALEAMRVAAKIDNRVDSLAADLDFHRAICAAAGNDVAATLWQAIARHVLIIFNRSEYRDENLTTIVRQHEAFLEFIQSAIEKPISDKAIERGLHDHLLQVSRAKKAR
ncbi:MAG: GntR family transcriptional regulator [Pseudomonadota bacterium]